MVRVLNGGVCVAWPGLGTGCPACVLPLNPHGGEEWMSV